MPQIIETEEGLTLIGGVNNIIKAIMEFKFQNPGINIYYGTPTQILATMRSIEADYPKFGEWEEVAKYINSNHIMIFEIPLLTDNYNVLEQISRNIMGMDISQRSIQRTIYGELQPLECIKVQDLEPVEKKEEKKNRNIKLYDEIGLANRFKPEEIKGIIETVSQEVDRIGKKYFLSVQNVEHKKKNNKIFIEIELKQKD
ncbi:MAG: hypothetical protein U5N58_08990 [Actinomycetota bacterium]|nr:hypothetical protein [Actinomycetota bacterium]